MPHAAFALVKFTAKVILLTDENLDCAKLFRCLRIHVKHIGILQTVSGRNRIRFVLSSCLFFFYCLSGILVSQNTVCISLSFSCSFFSLFKGK